MSLGDGREAESTAALRAMAHPLRLRMMSLLTAAPMTAAEVARELGLTHANASYHLRNLLAGGLILIDGEEKIRGGVAKRYRYDAGHDLDQQSRRGPKPDEQVRIEYAALAHELIRRTRHASFSAGPKLLVDAELWVDPEKWAELRQRVGDALLELHRVARPPRTPGTIRTSTTAAMFPMGDEA
ncbi:helix-turn-helix domain-containing protein [Actinoplanes sp. KI2]|uniref:ArsR/SmtB family transcription factor n=1 Tax=Actinoplanes sp. KI2 TaxID=2983315 RepID=UPI0021D5B280|nr:helix-turn-helix domain-containing protein [Actinoplanes sp. KI2]MCU7728274.1 helix-turn-helix domain-containing protein [Actinoplanes sp. KI2]